MLAARTSVGVATRRALARALSAKAGAHHQEPVVASVSPGGIATVTLNRPAKLNALDLEMVRLMRPMYAAFAKDPRVKAVVLRGAGEKAFCAGGDVASIVASIRTNGTLHRDFFREEYQLDYAIGTLVKPHVALIDGITMGGGVGLSVHGPFRVATERTLFAMPETAIGLFPDVGGSHFLSRLPGGLGMYLGLAGMRLRGLATLQAGIATHFSPSADLPALVAALEDAAARHDSLSVGDVRALLDRLCAAGGAKAAADGEGVARAVGAASANEIDSAFGKATSYTEILMRLQQAAPGSKWAQQTLETLSRASPTSLAVTFRLISGGALTNLRQAFATELRVATRFCAHPDFAEGVTALLIEKTKQPRWRPASASEVSAEAVAAFFAPLAEADERIFRA